MNGTDQFTSSEVAADDSEQNTVAAVATAPAGGDRAWDHLNFIHQEVCAYNLIPGMLIPHLRDREILAKVQKPRDLLANAEILARDAADMRERLHAIHAQHASRSGNSVDADDQLLACQIHEQYFNWGQTYDAVVLPTVVGMMEVLLDAGAVLDRERLSRSSSAAINTGGSEPAIDAGSFQNLEPAHV
jgi:hypothetical protein